MLIQQNKAENTKDAVKAKSNSPVTSYETRDSQVRGGGGGE